MNRYDELKLEVYESYYSNNITNEQKNYLLNIISEKFKEKSNKEISTTQDNLIDIPQLSFIRGKVYCYNKDTAASILEDPDVVKRIKKEWPKLESGMRTEITELMKHWELEKEVGIKSYNQLQRYMNLDACEFYKRDNGDIEFTAWYNARSEHCSNEFFYGHSYTATMILHADGKSEFEYRLEG